MVGVAGSATCVFCTGRLAGRGGLECSPNGDVIVSVTPDVFPSVEDASLFATAGLTASPAVSLPRAGSDGSGAAVLAGGVVSAIAGTGSDCGGEAAGSSVSAGAEGASVAGGASAAASGCASDKGVTVCCASAWFDSGVAGSAAGVSTCSTANVGCSASFDPNVTSGIGLRGRLANSSWVARSKAAAPRPKISIEIASATATNRERKPGSMGVVAPSPRVYDGDRAIRTRLNTRLIDRVQRQIRRIRAYREYRKRRGRALQKSTATIARRKFAGTGDAWRPQFATTRYGIMTESGRLLSVSS